MSFWKKVKLWLGIGGVSIDFSQVPSELTLGLGDKFSAPVKLSSKSDVTIVSIEGKLQQVVEERKKKKGEMVTETTTRTMGKMLIDKSSEMKSGEEKEIDFAFEVTKQPIESLSSEKGAMGMLGKMGDLASGRKVRFELVFKVDVKESGVDPSETKQIKFTFKKDEAGE